MIFFAITHFDFYLFIQLLYLIQPSYLREEKKHEEQNLFFNTTILIIFK